MGDPEEVLREVVNEANYAGVRMSVTRDQALAALDQLLQERDDRAAERDLAWEARDGWRAASDEKLAENARLRAELDEARAEKCWGDTPVCFTQAEAHRPGTCVCVVATALQGETPTDRPMLAPTPEQKAAYLRQQSGPTVALEDDLAERAVKKSACVIPLSGAIARPDPEEVLRQVLTMGVWTDKAPGESRRSAFAALDQLLQERDELIESNKIWQEVAAECVEAAGVAALVHVPARIRELEAERDARRDVAVELSKDLTDEAVEVARLGAELDEARAEVERAQGDLQRLASPTRLFQPLGRDEEWTWDEEHRRRLQYATASNAQRRAWLAAHPVEEPE